MKLSIGMIVKNEEKYLDRCLKAIKPILDQVDSELVIVDTGSSDATVNIAKKYTDKVYFHDWEDDFSKMRNYVLRYVTGEWFLFIDADEIIVDCEAFIKLINSRNIYFDIGLVEFNNIIDESSSKKSSVVNLPRIYKNDGTLEFKGVIHEQLPLKGIIGLSNLVVNHYGYFTIDKALMDRKFLRNKNLLEKTLEVDPNNIYALEQLSTTYGMFQEHEKADYYIKKAYSLIKPTARERFLYAYVYYGIVKTNIYYKNYEDAEKLALECLNVIDWHVDMVYFLTIIYYETNRHAKCIEYAEKFYNLCTSFRENSFKNISIMCYTMTKFENIKQYHSISLFYLKKYQEALDLFKGLDSKDPNFSIVLPFYILTIVEMKELHHLKGLYLVSKSDDALRLLFIRSLESEKLKRRLDLDLISSIEVEVSFFERSILLNDVYIELNHLRCLMNTFNSENEVESAFKKFEKFDFSEAEDCFGDVLYLNTLVCKPLLRSFSNVPDQVLKDYFRYIYLKYDDASDRFLTFLYKHIVTSDDTSFLRLMLQMIKWVLLDEKTASNHKKFLCKLYISYVCVYVEQYFNKDIVLKGKMELCKSKEECFQILIYKAVHTNGSDESKRLDYIKDAVSYYPALRDIIDYLINELEKDISVQLEIKASKRALIKSIEGLIQEGNLNEASILINQSEEFLFDVVEFYSMKSVIAIINKQYEVAKQLIKKGLETDSNNEDLLYNLAKVYDLTGHFDSAIMIYNQLLSKSINEDLKEDIRNILKK